MPTLGAYCLLAPHKENITGRNILLNIASKQTISPKCGHQPYTRQFEALTSSWAILFVNQQNKRVLRGRCAENPLVFPQSNDGSARDGRFHLSTNEELYATINATSFSTLKRVKGKP